MVSVDAEEDSDDKNVPISEVNRHWVSELENAYDWWQQYAAEVEREETVHCQVCTFHLRIKSQNGMRKQLPPEENKRRQELYRSAQQALNEHWNSGECMEDRGFIFHNHPPVLQELHRKLLQVLPVVRFKEDDPAQTELKMQLPANAHTTFIISRIIIIRGHQIMIIINIDTMTSFLILFDCRPMLVRMCIWR